jgi:cellulose synthase/poly-beta-1,6-N-acetylglucosamine synthase-like glycosyltransferase
MMAATVFLASAAFLLYVAVGYPLLLEVLARLRARPVHKRPVPDDAAPAVSVLLPVRNGDAWLEGKLTSLLALDYPKERIQVIVISDGSTDGTDSIATAYAGHGIRLVRIPQGGKAAALNAGLELATGDILFLTDVRQPLDREALRRLVECFADSEVGAASGELVLLEGDTQREASVGLYWRYEKWIRKNLSALDSVPGATGAIYAMRRSLARPMPADTLLDDVYLPLAAFFQRQPGKSRGYRIVFEEKARAYDKTAALEDEFRRKVRTLAGVYQIVGYYPALLGPRNRMWLHFVSHKLGRLLMPFAFVSLAVSSVFLPPGWREAAWAGQAGLYGGALIDLWLPRWFPGKALTAAARTLTVLMAAALCAIVIFFVPARKLWKPGGVSR